ncbi:MAG: UDP-N-acetylmuramate--L-alanine ligase, partial [Dethiobacteria bacterium]
MPIPPHINHIHFVGIGGYGMSALALILLKKGYRVSGSDLKKSQLTDTLIAQGAQVSFGHSADNIGAAELIIYSTAVNGDNPELVETDRLGLPLWHRSELLAALLNDSYGIAVAGAHGKTTTTAMLSLLLDAGGLDPTAIIGGVLPAYGSNARLGSSSYLVAEADESDSSFMRYYPRLALVTSIEPDHLEHYENDYARLQRAYATFLAHLPAEGTAVLNAEDSGLLALAAKLPCSIITYSSTAVTSGEKEEGEVDSFGSAAPTVDYHAANVCLKPDSSTFDLYHRGTLVASTITLGVPGCHNISNATGALAAAAALGLNLNTCIPALAEFHGVGRRFELIGEASGITVIDDYAHHPTEVKATLESAQISGRRVICLFQPHRYSRTANLFEEFAAAFEGAGHLLLHSIYSAGEAPLPGISSAALAERIRKLSGVPVTQDDDITALEKEAICLARPGDMIITMGAGD